MLSPLQQQALRARAGIGVRSPEFQHGRAIPREYTAFGDDVSPPLEWSGVPPAAGAVALVMDDPDAPSGTFTHWSVWNLPPRVSKLDRGANVIPSGGIVGRNDYGTVGYRGPKPPSGTHRYYFRVMALDRPLPLDAGAAADTVWRALAGHVLAWGELIGTFTRP